MFLLVRREKDRFIGNIVFQWYESRVMNQSYTKITWQHFPFYSTPSKRIIYSNDPQKTILKTVVDLADFQPSLETSTYFCSPFHGFVKTQAELNLKMLFRHCQFLTLDPVDKKIIILRNYSPREAFSHCL